jgi:glutathione peroxidase
MTIRAALLGSFAILIVAAFAAIGAVARAQDAGSSATGTSVLEFTMDRIDGTPQKLADFKGKVVMIVNVASRCGLTPQYKALEALYEEKKDAGFVILAFPANNFGNQEPGSAEEISEFCSSKYGVTFPLFAKVSVKGEDTCDLYRMLASLPKPLGGEPQWNFTKFLVDREGRVVSRFEPRTTPDDPDVRARIDALLAAKP